MLDPEPRRKPYWTALGRFIHEFSLMEYHFFEVLCSILDVSIQKGRILLSGQRVDGLIKLARRHYRAEGEAVPVKMELAMSQMVVINNMRSLVAHWGVSDWGDDFFIIRDLKKIDPTALKVTTDALENAALDMQRIHRLIEPLHGGSWPPGVPEPDVVEPWRCRPLEQAPTDHMIHGVPRSDPHPPQA